jgi:hypothetical protein
MITYHSKASKPKKSERTAKAVRSASALKGWKTRKANERKQAAEHKRRSDAAKRGWKTRKAKARKVDWDRYPFLGGMEGGEIRVTSVEQWEDNYELWIDTFDLEEEEWESTADYEESPS